MDFFTEVAHEIRTPLTLINGPLEIINETKISDPRLRKNLDTIGQNTRRLLSLASQLLDFRKVGTDHLKPVFENVNINKLLTATLERFEPTFAHNGKTLTISHIPVVFLTAKNDTDSKIEGLKAGAEAYVEKPFSY